MDKDSWDDSRYALEKQKFIAARLGRRFIGGHSWIIFAITWATGWGISSLLLSVGMRNMPLRYGLAFALSYPVFFVCVRLWADVIREVPSVDPPATSNLGSWWDLPVDGEGCLAALLALAIGAILTGAFALLGGSELLLEAAFEVAFAGTLVRRLRHFHVIGNWKWRLLRNTAPFALAVMVILVAIAAGLQHRVPAAMTVAQACRELRLGL